jgi:hypothetical protein
LAVRLVDLVLHGEVDEFGVGRRLTEGDGQEGYSLEVEGLIRVELLGYQCSHHVELGWYSPRLVASTSLAEPRGPCA